MKKNPPKEVREVLQEKRTQYHDRMKGDESYQKRMDRFSRKGWKYWHNPDKTERVCLPPGESPQQSNWIMKFVSKAEIEANKKMKELQEPENFVHLLINNHGFSYAQQCMGRTQALKIAAEILSPFKLEPDTIEEVYTMATKKEDEEDGKE